METKSYFGLTSAPGSAEHLLGKCYRDPDRDTARRFYDVNKLQPNSYLYPGFFYQAPSMDQFTDQGLDQFKSISDEMQYKRRNSVREININNFNEDFHIIKKIGEASDKLSDYFGGVDDYIDRRILNIKNTLDEMNDTIVAAKAKNIKYNAPQILAQRKIIDSKLNSQLTGLSRPNILKNAQAPTMKDALGMSNTVLKKQFRANPNATSVRQITKALGRADDLASKLKTVGTIGTALSFGSKATTVYETFRTEGQAAGTKAMGRESASFLGGMAGGRVGAWAGGAGATALMLTLGVGTGGAGFIVMGIGAVVGGLIGSKGGEALAEGSFDYLYKAVSN